MDNLAPKPYFFSIITVVYNAENYIEETIKSVIEQKFTDFEYIVIDGGSTDSTLEIIEQYRPHIRTLISEPDKGIYDAMNKGIGLAKGKYINFMNAGDQFYSASILREVHKHATEESKAADIIYGKVVKVSDQGDGFRYEKGKVVNAKNFFSSVPMCHQAMFISRELFTNVGLYSLDYRAGSFYGWLGAYYEYRRSLEYLSFLDQRIALYLDGGYSFQMKKVIDRERLIVARRYFSKKYLLLNYLIYAKEWIKANGLILMDRLQILSWYRKMKYKAVKEM